MPSPTPFSLGPTGLPALGPTARVKRPPGRPGKRSSQHQGLKATVSQETVNRLIDEACIDHRFEGLDRGFITEWVTARLATFLEKYPWWYGHLEIDKPRKTRPCAEAQIVALAKGRKVREANMRGYIPSDETRVSA